MIQEVVNIWLADIETGLIQNYDRLGLRASGDWADSLEQFQKKEGQFIKIGIKGNDYTEQLENGRRANKNAGGYKIGDGNPPDALRKWVGWAGSTFLKDWVESKNINASPFAIAWKIGSEGWSVPNPNNAGGLVSNVITKAATDDLNRNISKSIIDNFKSDVIHTFK